MQGFTHCCILLVFFPAISNELERLGTSVNLVSSFNGHTAFFKWRIAIFRWRTFQPKKQDSSQKRKPRYEQQPTEQIPAWGFFIFNGDNLFFRFWRRRFFRKLQAFRIVFLSWLFRTAIAAFFWSGGEVFCISLWSDLLCA